MRKTKGKTQTALSYGRRNGVKKDTSAQDYSLFRPQLVPAIWIHDGLLWRASVAECWRTKNQSLAFATHQTGICHFPPRFISSQTKLCLKATVWSFQRNRFVLGVKLHFLFSVSQYSQYALAKGSLFALVQKKPDITEYANDIRLQIL